MFALDIRSWMIGGRSIFFFTQVIVLQLCCIIHEYLDIVSIMHIIDSRYITEITFHGCLHMFFKLYGIDEDSIIVCCMSMFCYFTRCSSEFERSSFKWIPCHFPSISVAQSLYLAEGNKCTLVAALVAKSTLVDQRSYVIRRHCAPCCLAISFSFLLSDLLHAKRKIG